LILRETAPPGVFVQPIIATTSRKPLLNCLPILWTTPRSSRRAPLQSAQLPARELIKLAFIGPVNPKKGR